MNTGIRLTFACLALLLSGCAVRFAQLDTVQRFIPVGSPDPRLADYAWTISLNGVQYTVYPTRADGRRVSFVNGNGLRLDWDGESIIVLEGMPGAFGRYESGVEADERWYARAGMPVVRAVCSPGITWRLSESRQGWRQECVTQSAAEQPAAAKSLRSTHLVEFDAQGNITLIEASMSPGAALISLKFAGRR